MKITVIAHPGAKKVRVEKDESGALHVYPDTKKTIFDLPMDELVFGTGCSPQRVYCMYHEFTRGAPCAPSSYRGKSK